MGYFAFFISEEIHDVLIEYSLHNSRENKKTDNLFMIRLVINARYVF